MDSSASLSSTEDNMSNYFQELLYFSDFLLTNPLSVFWKKSALTHMPRKVYPILIPVYLAGMAGYALSLPLRVLGVAKDGICLIGDTFHGLKKGEAGERLLMRTIVLLGSLGDVGVACPPLAYFLDEKIQRAYFEIYDHSCTRWQSDKKSTEIREKYPSEIKKMVEARIALRPFVDTNDRSPEAYHLLFQASIHLWMESRCGDALFHGDDLDRDELEALQKDMDAQEKILLRDLVFRKLTSTQEDLDKPRPRNTRESAKWDQLYEDLDTFEENMSEEKKKILKSYCGHIISGANKLISNQNSIKETKVLYETAMKKIVLFV